MQSPRGRRWHRSARGAKPESGGVRKRHADAPPKPRNQRSRAANTVKGAPRQRLVCEKSAERGVGAGSRRKAPRPKTSIRGSEEPRFPHESKHKNSEQKKDDERRRAASAGAMGSVCPSRLAQVGSPPSPTPPPPSPPPTPVTAGQQPASPGQGRPLPPHPGHEQRHVTARLSLPLPLPRGPNAAQASAPARRTPALPSRRRLRCRAAAPAATSVARLTQQGDGASRRPPGRRPPPP